MDAKPEPEIIDDQPSSTAVIRTAMPMSELPEFFDRAFAQLPAALAQQGIAPAGAPFALYHQPPAETVELEVGFPTERPIEPAGEVQPASLPGGRIARLVHVGGYDGLGGSWERLGSWMAERGFRPGPVFWEVYLTEPTPDMDPNDLRTELNWPVLP